MKPVLIDTDILSMFFRGNTAVIAQFAAYLQQHPTIQISIITYYEIVSGLRHRNAERQIESFLRFTSQNTVLPLTEQSVTIAAESYAKLRAQGTPIDDIDLLIAGVAIANDLVLVTHNQRHFGRIEGLTLEDWSLLE